MSIVTMSIHVFLYVSLTWGLTIKTFETELNWNKKHMKYETLETTESSKLSWQKQINILGEKLSYKVSQFQINYCIKVYKNA